MKIFVFEFVTGGGCAGQAWPEFLADAQAMWQALVDDLIAVPGVEVISLRDARLARIERAGLACRYTDAAGFPTDFARCLAECDALWPLAPETGGLLEDLSRSALRAGKRLLGCHPDAVAVTASKRACLARLDAAGLRVPDTADQPQALGLSGPLVAKPDDGAGCQDTYWFADAIEAQRWWLDAGHPAFVFQPWLDGDALSLSLLCCAGQAQLLSVNRQDVRRQAGRLRFHGVRPACQPDPFGRYALLAECIAEALPGLWGYVGVDLIAGPDQLTVLEINPRLTVAYVGLSAALGVNLAERILCLPRLVTLPGTCRREPAHAC
jgi:predicted ATP-grasp superfamily ATP-dependent carboligase